MNLSNVYYHFTSDKLRDGAPIPPIGEWLIYPKKPIICQQGLHASKHPFDALKYAPGNLLHLVELLDITDTHHDKVVAKGRKILLSIDATLLLQRSARKFATEVLHLWDAPEVMKIFLKTGENASAAASAAWVATRAAEAAASAAWVATRAASVARAAARAAEAAASAARAAEAAASAARAATSAAASAASAASAAWVAEAAESIQREYFLREVLNEFNYAD